VLNAKFFFHLAPDIFRGDTPQSLFQDIPEGKKVHFRVSLGGADEILIVRRLDAEIGIEIPLIVGPAGNQVYNAQSGVDFCQDSPG
jgi:hypothetical protein